MKEREVGRKEISLKSFCEESVIESSRRIIYNRFLGRKIKNEKCRGKDLRYGMNFPVV